MTIPTLTIPPRSDSAQLVGDLVTGTPDVAQSPAPVPLAPAITKVSNSQTQLPRGSR